MGQAKRRKSAGDKIIKGSAWKRFKPSTKVKFLTKLELDQSGIVRWI